MRRLVLRTSYLNLNSPSNCAERKTTCMANILNSEIGDKIPNAYDTCLNSVVSIGRPLPKPVKEELAY